MSEPEVQPPRKPGFEIRAAPSAPVPPAAQPYWAGWTRGDRLILLIVVLVIAVVAIVLLARSWQQAPLETSVVERSETFTVNANSDGWVEFAQLPGIGEVLARRIVDDREKNGPFEKADDLLRVNGIGEKTLDAFRDQLRFEKK